MNMHTCKTCYRQFNDSGMKENAAGKISDMCRNCYEIVGKGPGYDSAHSDKEVEEWFTGTRERREELELKKDNYAW